MLKMFTRKTAGFCWGKHRNRQKAVCGAQPDLPSESGNRRYGDVPSDNQNIGDIWSSKTLNRRLSDQSYRKYGTNPHLESITVHPPEPLIFLNLRAVPKATCLIWEHTEDKPGLPCPNPRVILPRRFVPHVVDEPVEVMIRSFGIRMPPCTKEKPSYGIAGYLHVLPAGLAWLWRLVAPRGHDNPSITDTGGMSSEGVGSYWPFATGRIVDHANLLLRQIQSTPKVRYVLIPNQHVGAWRVSFMPQWISREYLGRRGAARFHPQQIQPSRCPLLGYAFNTMQVEGTPISPSFLQVETQPEVGLEGFDAGAEILQKFFDRELKNFLHPDLDPLGKKLSPAV